MIFIFGGKYQGKTAYALARYGETLKICDLAKEPVAKMYRADIIKNIQEGVRKLLREELSPLAYFKENLSSLRDKILIGTEIGCGIVPLKEEERIWRDETGRLYQLLAKEAQKVERVWAGIPIKIKDNEDEKRN